MVTRVVNSVALHKTALGILCLIPAGSLWLAGRVGVGMQGDSFPYAAAAADLSPVLLAGSPVNTFLNAVPGFVHWPIGYPIWLSVGTASGLPMAMWSLVSNAILASVLVLLTFSLAKTCRLGPLASLAAASFVALSPAVIEVAWRMQSEALFSVLFTAAILVLARTIRYRSLTWTSVAAVSVFSSGAYLVRYMGLFLIPVIFVGSVILVAQARTRAQILRVSVMMFGSCLGIILQGLRNVAQGSDFLYSYSSISRFTPGEVVGQAIPWVGSYWWPQRLPLASWAFSALVITLVAVAILKAVQLRELSVMFVGVAWLVFWSLLIMSIYLRPVSPVDWRFIHPVLPLISVLVVVGWIDLRELGRGKRSDSDSWTFKHPRWMSWKSVSTGVYVLLLLVMIARLWAEISDPMGAGATQVVPWTWSSPSN